MNPANVSSINNGRIFIIPKPYSCFCQSGYVRLRRDRYYPHDCRQKQGESQQAKSVKLVLSKRSASKESVSKMNYVSPGWLRPANRQSLQGERTNLFGVRLRIWLTRRLQNVSVKPFSVSSVPALSLLVVSLSNQSKGPLWLKNSVAKLLFVTGHTIVLRRPRILQPFLLKKGLFGLSCARDEVCNMQSRIF